MTQNDGHQGPPLGHLADVLRRGLAALPDELPTAIAARAAPAQCSSRSSLGLGALDAGYNLVRGIKGRS